MRNFRIVQIEGTRPPLPIRHIFLCNNATHGASLEIACSFFLILRCDLRKKEQAGGESGGGKSKKKSKGGKGTVGWRERRSRLKNNLFLPNYAIKFHQVKNFLAILKRIRTFAL